MSQIIADYEEENVKLARELRSMDVAKAALKVAHLAPDRAVDILSRLNSAAALDILWHMTDVQRELLQEIAPGILLNNGCLIAIMRQMLWVR